jgi:type III pantothenate kinase
VDVGNSHTGIGLVSRGRVTRLWRLTGGERTGDEVAMQLNAVLEEAGAPASRAGAVLCSVVPSMTAAWRNALERASGEMPLEVGPAAVRGLPILYDEPDAVGPDRLANAVGVRSHYGVPAIVVDLGTATNFDCVSARGEFLGGVLAPGVAVSAEALYRSAARLPRVALERPRRTLGRNTDEALRSGLVFGAAGMVDALVRRLAKEMRSRPHVVATGGLAWVIAKECETVGHIDEGLTMKGMARIWEEWT